MNTFVARFLKDEDGATAIEYGLIAALVAIVLITALQGLSGSLNGTFSGIATELDNAAPGGEGGEGGEEN